MKYLRSSIFNVWTFKLSIVLSTLYFVLPSCDKIEMPLEKKNTIDTSHVTQFDTTYGEFDNSKRIILLEDFTGHTCPNCPLAATKAKELVDIYPTQLMVVAIHAGYFAEPQNNANGSFKTDFRTTQGEIYVGPSGFAVQAFPSGLISRVKQNNNYIIDQLNWEAKILELKDLAPKFKIDLTNLYNDSLKLVKTYAKLKKTGSENINVKISGYLIEDKIIDWQINGSVIDSVYEHNHVLRKVVNGTWGEDITFANDTASFQYSTTLQSNWNRSHCELIIFVWDASTKEIYQVNTAKIGK